MIAGWRRPAHERDTVYGQVMTNGWNPERKAFTQHYDTQVLDSSLLMMPLMGFVSPFDPMWLQSLEAMKSEPVSDSLCRYNPSASPDGLAGSEGTFSLARSGSRHPSDLAPLAVAPDRSPTGPRPLPGRPASLPHDFPDFPMVPPSFCRL